MNLEHFFNQIAISQKLKVGGDKHFMKALFTINLKN